MCGIVGAVSRKDVVPALLEGLARLEYRGYDSAGLVVVRDSLTRIRTCARIQDLRKQVFNARIDGHTGIAHTRWATHGIPSVNNAHPHISNNLIAVVHNGIIENHQRLRLDLEASGIHFASDTDSEVIPHLIYRAYISNGGGLRLAVQSAIKQLEGSFAIAVIAADNPDQIVGARRGSPLLIGIGEGGTLYCASDVYALLPHTRKFVHLEDGDVADLRTEHLHIYGAHGAEVQRATVLSDVDASSSELGPYRHYMHKEIHEQPLAITNTIASIPSDFDAALFGDNAHSVFRSISRICIVACGTSYHAGLIAKHWIESLANMPCDVDIASEYRYRSGYVATDGVLLIAISQSGETADTLGALQYGQSRGIKHTLSICNVAESAMPLLCNLRFMTCAGPEIGVASTKAFTTQLASLYTLAVTLALCRGEMTREQGHICHANLRMTAPWLDHILRMEPALMLLARQFESSRNALFIGRGVHYPVAMEGALKLKEIAYIHAQAYAAGELKHGALALVSPEVPVVALAPNDTRLAKMKSNIQEVRARGGNLILLSEAASCLEAAQAHHVFLMPGGYGDLSPLPYAVALQLLAYHVAVLRGTDIDRPRNLAKSVTVE